MGSENSAEAFYNIINKVVVYEVFIQYGIVGAGSLYALYKMYRT